MEKICEYKDCTGCFACQSICPKNAISIEEDSTGFKYPIIDQNLCIDCHACTKVCPAINLCERSAASKAIAAINKDCPSTIKHASGGIATLISEWFIHQGGIVYGCSGESIENIHHIRVEKTSDLRKLYGSKYIQSSLTDIYPSIQKDLKENKKVLFIGVGCQVAAIKNRFKSYEKNLYTIDIICHGGSSQKILNSNLDYYKKKYKTSKLENVSFRKKRIEKDGNLSITYGFYFTSKGVRREFSDIEDMFSYGYANNLIFRESCYNCQFTTLNRSGDITLGDFWKLRVDNGKFKKKGNSLVLLNSAKGEEIWNAISSQIYYTLRPIEEATAGNPQLLRSSRRPDEVEEFRKLFEKNGLVKSVRKIYAKNFRNIAIYNFLQRFRLTKIIQFITR